jgi:uncharacterized protein YndB with AHSA1/START domain
MKTSKRRRRGAGRSERSAVLVLCGAALLCGLIVVIRRRSGTSPPRPIQFDQSVVIERPLEEVFAFLADPENDAQWTPVVTETRKTSEGPLGVGTRYEQSGHFLGRNFEMLFEVTEYEPNRKIGQRLITPGPLRTTGSSSVEAVSGGTQVTLTGEAQAGGFFWLLPDRIIAFPAQRIMGVALRNLKELLETPRYAQAP